MIRSRRERARCEPLHVSHSGLRCFTREFSERRRAYDRDDVAQAVGREGAGAVEARSLGRPGRAALRERACELLIERRADLPLQGNEGQAELQADQ